MCGQGVAMMIDGIHESQIKTSKTRFRTLWQYYWPVCAMFPHDQHHDSCARGQGQY